MVMAVPMVAGLAASAMVPAAYASLAPLAYAIASTGASMLLQKKTVIDQEGPRLTDLQVTLSTYGNPIPIIAGTVSVSGNMIWSSDKKETAIVTSQSSGKGGGGTTVNNTSYSYEVNCAYLIAEMDEGDDLELIKIYINDEIYYDNSSTNNVKTSKIKGNIKFYKGTEEQLPDETIEAFEGIGNVEAYRGFSYIVFSNWNLDEWGGNIPSNIVFEMINSDNVVKELKISNQPFDLSFNTSKFNKFNNSIIGFNSYSVTRVNPENGQIEASFNTNEHGMNYFNKVIDFTEEGDFFMTGVETSGLNGKKGVNILDKDTLQKKSEISYNLNFDNYEQRLPTRHFYYNKNYFGIHYSDTKTNINLINNNRDKIILYKYGKRFQNEGFSLIPFSKRETTPFSTQIFYSERKTSLSNSGYSDDKNIVLDKVKGRLYYYVFQEYNNKTDGTDTRRIIALNSIDLKSKEHREEFHYILSDNIQSNYIIHGMFFDNFSRNIVFIYTDTQQNKKTVFHKFNVDSETFEEFNLGSIENYSSTGTRPFAFSETKRTFFFYNMNFSNYSYYELNIDNFDLKIWENVTDIKPPSSNEGFVYSEEHDGLIYIAEQYISKNLRERFAKSPYSLDKFIKKIINKTGLNNNDIDVQELSEYKIKGYKIGTSTTARAVLEQLSRWFSFEVVESDYKIKFRKEQREISKHISYKDLSATNHVRDLKLASNVVMTNIQEFELPKTINITYLDIDRDYQQNTQDFSRYTVKTENIKEIVLPLVGDADFVKNLAGKFMTQAWVRRNTFSFETTYKYLELEPGDVVSLETKEAIYLVKISTVEIGGGIIKFQAMAEDNAIYNQNLFGSKGSFKKDEIKLVTNTRTDFLDIPILRNEDDDAGYYVATNATSQFGEWKGSSLYTTQDENGTFLNIESFYHKSTTGYTISKLADFSGNCLDLNSFVDVKILSNTLTSHQESEFLSGKETTFALIGNEIISFKNAILIDDQTYRLSVFVRGLGNTIKTNHSIDDRFILLNNKLIKRIKSDVSSLNNDFYFKNVTFGKSLNETATTIFNNSGKGLECYPVSNLNVNKKGNGDFTISWCKRVRGFAILQDFIDVYDLDSDKYQIDFLDVNNQVIRTVTIENDSKFTYSNSLKLADYAERNIQFKIYKLNRFGMRGAPLAYIQDI